MKGVDDTDSQRLTASARRALSSAVHRKPRFLIIGAGRRGTAYASAVRRERLPAIIAAVAEPLQSTRISFGKKYVWDDGAPREDQSFDSWQDFLDYESKRRQAEASGEEVYAGIDGIIVCTQDQTHKEILQAFGPLKLHVLSEKPIATSLQDCQDIYVSLGGATPETIFSTGHVLRYSPHNMLLRKLLLEDRSCDWSAKKLYLEKLYDKGERDWPICVVVPDIEDITATLGTDHGRAVLEEVLSTDYDASTPRDIIESKQWYGRCVWESDNDVLDDQIVTLTWDDDSGAVGNEEFTDRGPKTAIFHMAAFTEAQSKRRGKISGTHGEMQYDSNEIRVYTFDRFRDPGAAKVFIPPTASGGHEGGDGGLMNNFSRAVEAVINGELSVEQAQARHVGCTLKEAFMSHAMVSLAGERA
ncbi:streptomycin biosynthesis protein StrI [Colletotrichum tamarilloi]|uniref:Streptomycin biosynthesis protein StrI n=1 Tax=Colletotrichum tamarilloi TaxID=1209934 RepID=A0ABQ9RVF7_9PEZI|nr:streptomycin biosynthesis protein StrI [Colletotrichum tamarilloi]KAK1513105.1 streptomycin biosynthesis protein StrI [Colletotrichum tamarilloi]